MRFPKSRVALAAAALITLGACGPSAPSFNEDAVMALLKINFPYPSRAAFRQERLSDLREVCAGPSFTDYDRALSPNVKPYILAGCPSVWEG